MTRRKDPPEKIREPLDPNWYKLPGHNLPKVKVVKGQLPLFEEEPKK